MKKLAMPPVRVLVSSVSDQTRSLGLVSLLATALLGVACGSPEAPIPSTDTLASEAWPTEVLASASGKTRGALRGSWQAGRLDDGVAAGLFTPDFRGEDFAERPAASTTVRSGLEISHWAERPASLDAAAFVERWNLYLEALGTVETVESHTWEVQLRPRDDGRRGIELHEALWVLARAPDGRAREERLYLVLDLVEEPAVAAVEEGEEPEPFWRLSGVRSEEGRTVLGPGPFFVDVTSQALPPGYDQIGAQIYTDAGPALADFDADGDVDLFLPRLHAPALLYENDGEGFYDDATARRGLALNMLREGSNTGLFLDLDGDGDLDLLVGLKQKGFLAFLAEDGSFHPVTPEPFGGEGEWETVAAADFDDDGLVDFYACNYGLIDPEHQPESYVDAWDGRPNALFHNLGGGQFEDVTEATGLAATRNRWSYAATWADYDRDGDMDLFVANDYGPKSLFRNRGRGDDGQVSFEEVTEGVGARDQGNGMGASWLDFDGDLWLDLYASNMQSFAGNRITLLETFPGSEEQRLLYRRFAAGNTLLRNLGDDSPGGEVGFEDVTDAAGVRGAFWAWGNLAFDYESDGDMDLFACGGFYTGASAADT